LSPALFRDAARSATLAQRGFGAAAKALLFDLGREDPSAPLQVSAGLVTRTVEATGAFERFSVSLPHGVATLHAAAGMEIEDLAAETSTAAQGS
jgi:hypothetical protein